MSITNSLAFKCKTHQPLYSRELSSPHVLQSPIYVQCIQLQRRKLVPALQYYSCAYIEVQHNISPLCIYACIYAAIFVQVYAHKAWYTAQSVTVISYSAESPD